MVTHFDRGSGRRGDEVYESLATGLAQAEQRVSGLGAELDRLRHEAENARHQEVERTARLARARLDALDAEQIAGPLDSADQEALELLAERDRQRDQLVAELEDSVVGLARLDAARDTARDAHAAAEAERDELRQLMASKPAHRRKS